MRVFSWNEVTSPDFDSNCFEKGTAVSVGSFDGPHIGHKSLFDALFTAASKNNLFSCIVTFKCPLPTVKYPKDYIGDIATFNQRLFEFERLGIDFCIISEFSENFRTMDGMTFLLALKQKLKMKCIVEGRDFHFGRKGSATIDDINTFCAENGLECIFPDFIYLDGKRISSSSIRNKIKCGLLDDAARILGREFELDVREIEGKQILDADKKNSKPKRMYEREKIHQVLPKNGEFLMHVNGMKKRVFISEKDVIIEG